MDQFYLLSRLLGAEYPLTYTPSLLWSLLPPNPSINSLDMAVFSTSYNIYLDIGLIISSMALNSFAPVICFLLIFIFVLHRFDDKAGKIRDAFAYSVVVWGMLIFVSTEALSAFKEISFIGIISFWYTVSLFLLILLYAFSRGKTRFSIPIAKPINTPTILIFTIIAVFISFEWLIAIIAPPTNWDSMTYHLSRIAHWIQNRSVAFYPTSILRQNYQMPWAEFASLHFQILSGGDHWANLIQWFSMVGNLVGVSLIARELGADSMIQAFTSLVAVTIPMGILQASSTQNDLVGSLWLVCLVYFLLRLRRQLAWKDAFAAGTALGLALDTKGTGYIYAFPFLTGWFLVWVVQHRSEILQILKRGLLIGALGMATISPQLVRNAHLFGHPFGPRIDYENYHNDELTVPIVFANVVRNAGLHLGTPWKGVNSSIQSFIQKVLGKEINNPISTWGGETFRVSFSFHEDSTGNPLHLLMWWLSAIFVLLIKKIREDCTLVAYSLFLAGSFLLFSIVLRWQPWHSRLHLPLFILAAPLIAVSFAKISSKKQLLIIAFLVSGLSFPWLLLNVSRPLIGNNSVLVRSRDTQYFAVRPGIEEAYKGATSYVCQAGYHNIGLVLDLNDWEYPIWVFLQKECPGNLRIEHVNVPNISNRLKDQGFSPEVIIATRNEAEIPWSSVAFREMWSAQGVGVYIP